MFVVAVSFSRRSSNGIVRFFGASRTRSGYEGFSTLQKGSQLGSSKGGAIAFDSSVTEVSHPAFVALTHDIIEEYGVHATLYRHKKSGAQVLSVVAPEDNNKVFGVTFRTPPDDSKGLPHILEHSVLCGSRKFPVKEPFVDLMKGSLNTFLNAFTYPDRTCYPVASMNTKDFYNLIHVYMDAVFHPRAVNDPQVLEQEGWHFELEKPEDPLTFKGVVYNEMKGVYSSPDSIMGRATQRALFPDNTYSVDSGGDPLEIPKLGFDQFKSFHSKYYHPSNARVYFYGDDDPSERLRLLDSYLDEFTAIEVDSTISTQRKFTEPRRIDVKFPIATGTEPKYMLTVNWLLNEESMPHPERLAVGVLESLLLGTSSSPLRKKLIESGFGEGLTGGGLSDELLQSTFSVGLKGVKPENADKIEQLVLDELARLQKEGFDQGDVRAALNTLEFSLREFNTGGFPRGLSLMLGFLGDWIYDRDPLDGVRFEEALQTLKTDLAAGKPVFQSLLQKYFVDNRHRVTVEARPDETLEAMQQQAEAATLAEVKAGLGSADLDKIIQSTKDLKAAQAAEDSAEAKASIPRLSLADLEREVKTVPIEVQTFPAKGATILTHELTTNGILYADVALDYSKVLPEDIEILSLFSRMVLETGTADLDEAELQRRIGSETGGISTSFFSEAKAPATPGTTADMDDPILYFIFRGKATKERAAELFELMSTALTTCRLDNQKRAVELLKESKIRRESSVVTSGHSYASTRLAAQHSLLGLLNEKMGGITAVQAAGRLLTEAESDWPKFQARLERVRAAIAQQGDVVINLTGSADVLAAAAGPTDKFINDLAPASASTNSLVASFDRSQLIPAVNEGFSMASQVNYVAKSCPIISPNEKVKSSFSVASRYLSTGYLWDNVRVIGGAYGGFSRFSTDSGRVTFLSYRDPGAANTLEIYDKAADAMTEAELTDEDILQAVIGAVGDMDSPQMPDMRGFSSMVRYLTGTTDQERQRRRDEILSSTTADFRSFANKLQGMKDDGSTVIFGSQAALEAANSALPERKRLVISPAV